jgi:hypothetical protein
MTVKKSIGKNKKERGPLPSDRGETVVRVCVCGGERERSPLLLDQRAKALGQLYVMCTKKE